jgi:nitronate monooxygenase
MKNKLRIGDLHVETPIIQGGMGVCVSLSGLASAVANEGGIGVISAVGIGMKEPDFKTNLREANKRALRKEIRTARLKTNGIIGVNIMMAVTDFDDLLELSVEEGVDVVIVGAGLPLKKPKVLNTNTKTKFIPKVSSARAAKLIFKHWSDKYNQVPDAVIVEGPLAGGHLGFKKDIVLDNQISLESIVKDTLKEIAIYEQKYGIEIPLIAGGGIYTGSDMFHAMEYGAKGVKMGTRFVTTHECDASDVFKQNYLSCSSDDIRLIDSPVGLPGRVINNSFVEQIQAGALKPVHCLWKCLKTCKYKEVQFCIAEALFNAANGDLLNGFSFAGTKAYLANEILSVKETINLLKKEYLNEQIRLAGVSPYHAGIVD